MKGKLIVIEGSDGSGKQTQTNLLYQNLTQQGLNVQQISFPNYQSPASEPLKMYLSGMFGEKAHDTNIYAASTFYAIDRFASFKLEWEKFYNEGGLIICDRYTTSNMVHQAGKIKDQKEKSDYLNRLTDFEWGKFGLPRPDLVFFLDVAPETSLRLMEERKNKFTNEKQKDIHERDPEFLKASYLNAKEIASTYDRKIMPCEENGQLKSIENIQQQIILQLKENKIIG